MDTGLATLRSLANGYPKRKSVVENGIDGIEK